MIVVAAMGYFWAVFVAMHFLQPEFDPIRAPGSAYVLGPYGAWVTSSYFALSAAHLGMARCLALELPPGRMRWIPVIIFCVVACGGVLAGTFPMDYPGPPQTLSGRLHAIGGALSFPPWVIGVLIASFLARRDPRWADVSRSLLVLSLGAVGMFALLVSSFLILGFAGYAQRLVLLLLSAWLVVVARHLIRGVPAAG